MSARIKFFLKYLSFYPPFLGAGIQVIHVAPDFRTVRVRMKLTFVNRNAVGTQFGGSLYAMCDPFFMLILMVNLGDEYIVWDKGASIRFLRPGRGTVYATFHIPQEKIDEIRTEAERQEKVEPTFQVDVVDDDNQVIAHVDKLLYVRKKRDQAQENPRTR